ncbi:MAG: hypothetical protein Q7R96_01635 [Nanoarchaeota archaeon]|nr:hypothetical protein [Nanoarchaeota archaeon]
MDIPIRESLEEKLEDTHNALALAKQLQGIIEHEKVQEVLTANMKTLQLYEQAITKEIQTKKEQAELDQQYEHYLDTVATATQQNYNSYAEARTAAHNTFRKQQRKNKQHPYLALLKDLKESITYTLLATVHYPISRTRAQQKFRLAHQYFTLAKMLYHATQATKNALKRCAGIETQEATLADTLVNIGMTREVADTLINNPPYLTIAIIHSIKEQHVPWL